MRINYHLPKHLNQIPDVQTLSDQILQVFEVLVMANYQFQNITLGNQITLSNQMYKNKLTRCCESLIAARGNVMQVIR